MIGKKGLVLFFQFFKKLMVPIILETPVEGLDDDIRLLIGMR
jgi:endonuclease IV